MPSHRGGRGNSRRGGGGDSLPRDVLISKKFSRLLRHDAENQGLTLGPGGYVNLKDVLNTKHIRGLHVTLEEVRAVVEDNEKQRFSLIPKYAAPGLTQNGDALPIDDAATVQASPPADFDENDPSNYLIRANQGHSIKIEDEGLLTPLTLDDPSALPRLVVHGTNHSAWPLILKTGGLKRMERNHVHFACGLPKGIIPLETEGPTDGQAVIEISGEATPEIKDQAVVSGMRSNSSILMYLDLPAALEGGLKFGMSQNGVILTEGNEDGFVLLKYFKRIEDRRKGQGVLMRYGELAK